MSLGQNMANFRDYLNAMPDVAAEYESLKVKLAAENPHEVGRGKYSAGKRAFIEEKWFEARVWDGFGRVFTQVATINKGWTLRHVLIQCL